MTDLTNKLTIVVPLYNEADSLENIHRDLVKCGEQLARDYSIQLALIFINDGSVDETWEKLQDVDPSAVNVSGLSFSRNFGKEAALLAGLEAAEDDSAVLFMDGDGQHPVELVPLLVGKWLNDAYDVVYTYKENRRGEGTRYRFSVKLFYGLVNWGTRAEIPSDAGDFRLLSPRAASALRQLPERHRFFKGLSSWIGFRQAGIPYVPLPRSAGKTSWNFFSLLGLSIEGLTSFSVAPLRIASLLGICLSLLAFFYGAFIIGQKVIYDIDIAGYPSLIAGVMIIGGVQLLMIGILGEYIGRILGELKARPVYFVADSIRIDEVTKISKPAPSKDNSPSKSKV